MACVAMSSNQQDMSSSKPRPKTSTTEKPEDGPDAGLILFSRTSPPPKYAKDEVLRTKSMPLVDNDRDICVCGSISIRHSFGNGHINVVLDNTVATVV